MENGSLIYSYDKYLGTTEYYKKLLESRKSIKAINDDLDALAKVLDTASGEIIDQYNNKIGTLKKQLNNTNSDIEKIKSVLDENANRFDEVYSFYKSKIGEETISHSHIMKEGSSYYVIVNCDKLESVKRDTDTNYIQCKYTHKTLRYDYKTNSIFESIPSSSIDLINKTTQLPAVIQQYNYAEVKDFAGKTVSRKSI